MKNDYFFYTLLHECRIFDDSALGVILIVILLKLCPPVCYWMTMADWALGHDLIMLNSSHVTRAAPHLDTQMCTHLHSGWLVTFRLDSTKYYTQFRFRSIHKKTGNHLRHQINLTLPALTRLDTFEADVVCLLCVGLSFASSHFKSKTKLVRQKGTKTVFTSWFYKN